VWEDGAGWAPGPSSLSQGRRSLAVRTTRPSLLHPFEPDPSFERLETALLGKEPDRVPLIELTVDREVEAALLGRPVSGLCDEVGFWLAAGYDYIPLSPAFEVPAGRAVAAPPAACPEKGEPPERVWCLKTRARAPMRTPADLDACEWLAMDDSLFCDFEEIRKYLPPGMKVIGCVPGLVDTVTGIMGLEAFCVALYECTDLVEALFQRAGALIESCIQRMLQYDTVGAVWIADDLAHHHGPLFSPAMLRRYVFPRYKSFTGMAHAQGRPALLHTCGNPTALFEDIVGAGFDALHPLEAGCVDIYEAKERLGGRICLCGNLDLTRPAPALTGSQQIVVEDVKEHLRRLAPGGGYCLGSSHGIAGYVPLESYLAMNRACLAFGRYPISL